MVIRRLESVITNAIENPEVAKEIAFHLVDCSADIQSIADVLKNNNEFSDQQIEKLIFVFLAHAPNHLAAAKKLIGLGPIEDIFRVGVLTEEE